MQKAIFILILIALALAGAWYWSVWKDRQAIERVQVLPPPVAVPEPEPPAIEFPVGKIETPPLPDPEPPAVPLPTLGESDAELVEHGVAVFGAEAIERYALPELVVSRLVATVDSLTSAQVAPLMLPVRPVPGQFTVQESGEDTAISPQNADRYAPYVALFEQAETDHLVALYVRYYPLFQEAYTAQGYPDAYFNDRLVAVLDHLLAAPEPQGPVTLRKVEGVYEYTDAQLESLSAGQKILVRMGPEQARKVKQKLREIRSAITGVALTE